MTNLLFYPFVRLFCPGWFWPLVTSRLNDPRWPLFFYLTWPLLLIYDLSLIIVSDWPSSNESFRCNMISFRSGVIWSLLFLSCAMTSVLIITWLWLVWPLISWITWFWCQFEPKFKKIRFKLASKNFGKILKKIQKFIKLVPILVQGWDLEVTVLQY